MNRRLLVLVLVLAGCSKDPSKELSKESASYVLHGYVKLNYCQDQGDKVNGCVGQILEKTTSLLITTPTQRHMSGHVAYKADDGRPCWDDVTGTFNKTSGGAWVLSAVSGQPHCPGSDQFTLWKTPDSFEWPIIIPE